MGVVDVVEVDPVGWCVASGECAALVSDGDGFALVVVGVADGGAEVEWYAECVGDECLDFGVAVEESGGAVLESDAVWGVCVDGV